MIDSPGTDDDDDDDDKKRTLRLNQLVGVVVLRISNIEYGFQRIQQFPNTSSVAMRPAFPLKNDWVVLTMTNEIEESDDFEICESNISYLSRSTIDTSLYR